MLKKMLAFLSIPYNTEGERYNGKAVNPWQWNVIVTVSHCCGKMNNGLKQYYADLLMLELLTQGRL